MLMSVQPIYDAYKSIVDGLSYKPLTVYLSPQGKVFDQSCAAELAVREHIVLLCGHYEGVDQRVLDEIVDMELSIGDFVLTGGEIPAMAVSTRRRGSYRAVLASANSYTGESHYNSLLEYPQYTRRPKFWADVCRKYYLAATMPILRCGSGNSRCGSRMKNGLTCWIRLI